MLADPYGAVFMLLRGMVDQDLAPLAPGTPGGIGWNELHAGDGAGAVGGMMTRMPESPGTFWLHYFNVNGIDAAVARAVEAGGKLIMGPHQIPGGSWIANCLDPQGVIFAMVSLQR